MNTTIIFNGNTYNSLDEMPLNERQAYEQMMNIFMDRNGNGIPDFLEGDMAQNVMSAFTSSINVNGKSYGSVNELPDDLRARVQGAFEKMEQFGIVTKGASPMMMPMNDVQVQRPQAQSKPFVSREFSPAIQEEDNKPNIMLWVLAIAALLFCLAIAAIVVFYFMFMG